MPFSDQMHDVIIVGGSFAGLSAALMLARARQRVLIIDGGRPRNRFASHAHGLLGHDGKPPAQLLDESIAQVMAYPTVSFQAGLATDAARDGEAFQVTLDEGGTVHGRRLILASGVRDVLPDIAGLASRWGQSVLHCPYCHGYEFAGQALGVLANSPMSPHQAQVVVQWGPTIYFSQGRHAPDDAQRGALQAFEVRFEDTPVVALEGEGDALSAVRLADGRRIELQALFTAPRVALANPLLEPLGCALAEGPMGPYVQVDETRQTNVPGMFAAGDLAGPMPSLPLAVSSGAMAGLGAHRSLIEARLQAAGLKAVA